MPTRRPLVRLLSVALAAVAALLVWVVAVPLLGVELRTTDFNGNPMDIGPQAIITMSVGPALAGWALIALLERLTPARATLAWTVVAGILLVLSMLPVTGMPAAAAVVLGLMHLVVGGIIIWTMRGTAPAVTATPAAAPDAA